MNTRESKNSKRLRWKLAAVATAIFLVCPAQAQESGDGVEAISQAQGHFNQGVSLYNQKLYREALSEFNRAIALDPGLEDAAEFRDLCEGKLNMTSAGAEPDQRPMIRVVDPDQIQTGSGSNGLALDPAEVKRENARDLLIKAEMYLEQRYYERAIELFDRVLLIVPKNQRARDGLHEATLGLGDQNMEDTQRRIMEDRKLIERQVIEAYELPEGAGPDGLKDIGFNIGVEDDYYDVEEEPSIIERALESPVSVTFENEHIEAVLEFISEYLDINFMLDYRVVDPPEDAEAAAGPGGPAAGPGGGPANRRPQQQSPRFQQGGNNNDSGFAPVGGFNVGQQGNNNSGGSGGGVVTDGYVPYINLREVSLKEALRALLRPLNLDYKIQPGFIWVTTHDNARHESFEELETRIYELRNAGAETMFKIVVENSGGGGQSGGQGGGQTGGGGGFGGGGGGGVGGGGGISGGGGGGGFGGGGGGGGFSGGGGGGGVGGGGGGGRGGGGGGQNGGAAQFTNISELFTTVDDESVGESPAVIGLSTTGTGGNAQGGINTNNNNNANNNDNNENTSQVSIINILNNIIPDVREPFTRSVLSYMDYNPATNQLIVHNTPSNLKTLEKMLRELDIEPKQVSIEAKFVRLDVSDVDKIGFNWNLNLSDQNSRNQQITDVANTSYTYDINGDGTGESIPFYQRPDGSNVITNTVTSGLLNAAVSPGVAGNMITAVIQDNEDGDTLSVALDYLSTLTETEVLSAPRATTMNRKPVVVADFQTQWFAAFVNIGTTVGTGGGNFGGSGAVATSFIQPIPQQFIFGITLSVTPQISGSDRVRMWINPQVVTQNGFDEFEFSSTLTSSNTAPSTQTATIRLPRTTTQAIWTNVIVHDGDTLVLGGSIRDQTDRAEDKVPYLSDIPVLGALFRGKSRTTTQSSLLIFVTPDIIDATGARLFDPGTDF